MKKFHDHVLTYFLNFKKNNPDFTFVTRVNDMDNRLSIKNFWFLGDEQYISIPLFRRTDAHNQLKTISFVVRTNNNSIVITYRQITGMTKNENNFYTELVSSFTSGSIQNNQVALDIPYETLDECLQYYTTVFRKKCIELLAKYNLLEKYILNEATFEKNISKINKIRDPIILRNKGFDDNLILYGPPGTGKTFLLKKLQSRYIHSKYKLGDNLSKNYEFITFHESYGYEQFVEGSKTKINEKDNCVFHEIEDGIFKSLCKRAQEKPWVKYALFIDEINRGNISKIFGEVITLIEESKRIGNEDEMMLSLPYSGELFGIPSNITIFATMNTHRSITPLDNALRRRFEFIEIKPDCKKLSKDIEGIDLSLLLNSINKRILYLCNKDYMIGHTYFMNCDNFEKIQSTFSKKIIPLLQEYFYDDWEKINLVFNNNAFIFIDENFHNNLFSNCNDLNMDDDKTICYINFNSLKDKKEYLKIYE